MPVIRNPYVPRTREASSNSLDPAPTGGSHPPRVRIRTAARRGELTRALAHGADPSTSLELGLRAAQLTSARNRRALARSLRRTLAEARRPPFGRAPVVIIRRRAVVEAEDAIRSLIDRLSSVKPVRAEGVAIVYRLLTNADASPLYNSAEPGMLARMVLVATSALDDPSNSHEFSIAV